MDQHRRSIRGRAQWRELSRYVYSYLPDWILAIVFYLLSKQVARLPGFKRRFSLIDITLQYPYAVHERVTSHENHLISALGPALVIPILNLIFVRDLWDLHNAWLGLALSLSLSTSLTNIIKITVGRPRPDVIDRCQPSAALLDSAWGLVDYHICTQKDASILKDGFRSFPSGHSSLAFAGLGFLSLYLAGKLRLWDERGYTGKAWLSLVPISGATLIAISRTMDYRHHWQDVLIGSALGMTLAFFSYRQFFPSLTHPNAHVAFKPRFVEGEVIQLEGTDEEREGLYRDREGENGDVANRV